MLERMNINDYLREYPVQWVCEMPDGCPPDDIMVPHLHTFFRYAYRSDSYSAEDFKSYYEMNPQKDWGDMLPLAVGLSLIDNLAKAKKSTKLPMLRKYKGIINLELQPQDGVVKQTGVHKSHYTWWRTVQFDMENLQTISL